jgi:hypothetical protein
MSKSVKKATKPAKFADNEPEYGEPINDDNHLLENWLKENGLPVTKKNLSALNNYGRTQQDRGE